MTGPFCRMVICIVVACVILRGPLPASATPARQTDPWIRYDQLVQGRLSEGVAEQQWLFAADAGDVVLIDMRTSDPGALDPYLTLLAPDGSVLIKDDDGGEGLNARIGPLPLGAGGDFTVIASSYNGTGAYTLVVRNLSTIPTLVPGKPLTGTLSAEHSLDYYRIEGPAVGAEPLLLHLEVNAANPAGSPALTLSGPAGVIATTEYDASEAIDPAALLPGQTYTVGVSWNSGGAGGPYLLTASLSEVGMLEAGQPAAGTLRPDASGDEHFFWGAQDEVIRITVLAERAPTPSVTISTADRATELFSAEGEYAQTISLALVLPADGMYVVTLTGSAFQIDALYYTLQIDRGTP